MTTIEQRRSQLQTRREELVQRMQAVEAELASHSTPDWEDQAIEQESDEVLERMGQAARAEVLQIDAALGRIEAQEYGYCTRCGAEIGAERLDLLPFTPFCRDCAP
jgi:RNA polymerase-binding protein DksA